MTWYVYGNYFIYCLFIWMMFSEKYIDDISHYKGIVYIKKRNISISVGIVFLICAIIAFIYLKEIASSFVSVANYIGLGKAAKDLDRYWFLGYIIWPLAPFVAGIFMLLMLLPYWIMSFVGEIIGMIINSSIKRKNKE